MSIRSLRGCASLGCAAALATVTVGVPAARASTPGCAPPASTVLASSATARLYSTGGALYGCVGSRTTRLGALNVPGHFAQTRVAHYALGGHYAGLDVAEMGVDTFSSAVSVIDLATGRRIAEASATSPENRAESFITASSLVIDAHGTLAWIGSRSAVGAFTPVYEVRTLGSGGERLLDSGAHIKSLTLRGRTLTWSDGAKLRHAQLKP